MENGAVSSEPQQGSSNTYWVRETEKDAAPLPVPRKLSSQAGILVRETQKDAAPLPVPHMLSSQVILAGEISDPHSLGSVWNRAGILVRETQKDAAPLPVPRMLSSQAGILVRETQKDAAPLPVPHMLSSQVILAGRISGPHSLGSVWNQAGIWEEKNVNKWASERMKELLMSVASLEFSSGKAEISDVSKCVGVAFLDTVRNKKRVGYTYEFTLKVIGEWSIKQEKRVVKVDLDVPEFSFGLLDDLQIAVRLSEEKDLRQEEKSQICQDLKQFLHPVREKLLQFEQELKER